MLDALIAGVVFLPLNPVLYRWGSGDEPRTRLFVALFIPAMLLALAYLAAFDGSARGATPGKRILGLRVADMNSSGRIGFRRAALRRLVYLAGAITVFAGWLWLFTNPRRQTWHDMAARTLVIRT
jgi:uncharacterized RDD family membrane protein YckC